MYNRINKNSTNFLDFNNILLHKIQIYQITYFNIYIQYTSFPLDLMKSISSVLKVAIDILFTLCGGVNPRLKNK